MVYCLLQIINTKKNNIIPIFTFGPSPGVVNAVGLRAQGDNGFIAADIERSSLILCGKGFSDANGVKEALAALSGPVIIARGGLLLCAR